MSAHMNERHRERDIKSFTVTKAATLTSTFCCKAKTASSNAAATTALKAAVAKKRIVKI